MTKGFLQQVIQHRYADNNTLYEIFYSNGYNETSVDFSLSRLSKTDGIILIPTIIEDISKEINVDTFEIDSRTPDDSVEDTRGYLQSVIRDKHEERVYYCATYSNGLDFWQYHFIIKDGKTILHIPVIMPAVMTAEQLEAIGAEHA